MARLGAAHVTTFWANIWQLPADQNLRHKGRAASYIQLPKPEINILFIEQNNWNICLILLRREGYLSTHHTQKHEKIDKSILWIQKEGSTVLFSSGSNGNSIIIITINKIN